MSRSTKNARLEALEAQYGNTGTLADALKAVAACAKAIASGADARELARLDAELKRVVAALPADVVAALGRISDDGSDGAEGDNWDAP